MLNKENSQDKEDKKLVGTSYGNIPDNHLKRKKTKTERKKKRFQRGFLDALGEKKAFELTGNIKSGIRWTNKIANSARYAVLSTTQT